MSLISHLEEKYGEDFIDSLSDEQKDLFKRRSKFFEFALRALVNREDLKIEDSPLSERDVEFLNEETVDYSYYSIKDRNVDICYEWAIKLSTSPLYARLYRIYIKNNRENFKQCIRFLIKTPENQIVNSMIEYAFSIDDLYNSFCYFELYATAIFYKNISITRLLEQFVNDNDFKNVAKVRKNLQSINMIRYDYDTLYDNSKLLTPVETNDLIREIAATYLGGKYSEIILRVANDEGMLIIQIPIHPVPMNMEFMHDNIAFGNDVLHPPPHVDNRIENIAFGQGALPANNNINVIHWENIAIGVGELIVGGNNGVQIIRGDVNQVQDAGIHNIVIHGGGEDADANIGLGHP